ncbi:EF-P lysine aminoacylase EpmA [Pontiella sulfatireligans]|uniref:Elongation factor P--(R)-beta-lysine ligase n=1 Tax=Pontiella sulfatireligans TaxID=2750658 RepID=A0A6C2UWT4_9BACT|nr:EF-P lysine aminoacylase EpmA [Pontiella sulfatireligans]VGO23306.1 Elongation factor P--(R)-beta-lysine ligase [Pontiella sulfatireligans]
MRRIRAFFYERGFSEVETPIRVKTPCMELHIDAEPSGDHFLRTSPEMFHKRLLAHGHEKIFEVGKCFRSGERGPLHHPEYTMIEWYRAQTDYLGILEDTKALIATVWESCSTDWKLIAVSEAFLEHAGWDPAGNYDEDRFDIDLVEKVEPALKAIGGPVVLIDYPVEAAALSRRKPGNPLLAERWELYIDGIELANAYSELTDPAEQRLRFEKCAEHRKALGAAVYPIDEAFLQALETMPPSGGVALGVDRLLMLISGAPSLDQVLPFR